MSTEMLINDTNVASVCICGSQDDVHPEATRWNMRKFTDFWRVSATRRSNTLSSLMVTRMMCFIASRGPQRPARLLHLTATDALRGIVLSRCDEPAQRINVAYKLVGSRDNVLVSWLTAEQNPTTMLVGNNVFPATQADAATGEFFSNTSSHSKALKAALCSGFQFLTETYRQVLNTQEELFSTGTLGRIIHGDFSLARVQWAAYLPAADRVRFLQLITILYGQTIAQDKEVISLATRLDLISVPYPDPDNHLVTGVMLIKRHGKKYVSSVVFYDKRERIAQMHQGKTLTVQEAEAIHGHVRIDITAHAEGIVALSKGCPLQTQTDTAAGATARSSLGLGGQISRGGTEAHRLVAGARRLRLVPFYVVDKRWIRCSFANGCCPTSCATSYNWT